jgi:hypothetical protein
VSICDSSSEEGFEDKKSPLHWQGTLYQNMPDRLATCETITLEPKEENTKAQEIDSQVRR